MERPGPRTAGYVVGGVVTVPLVLLGVFFAGLLGPLGLAVALVVTGLCAVVAARARSRDASRTSST